MTGAEAAQRIRKALLAWPDLADVYGPQAGTVAGESAYFLRFEMDDGKSFSIELLEDKEESS